MRCAYFVHRLACDLTAALLIAGAAQPGELQADAGRNDPSPQAAKGAPGELEVGKLRFREGARLTDAVGRFRQNGDSITFFDAQNREIGGLPNLNLERVSRMLKSVEEPESIVWTVSGVITEFGGRNFILIGRAVYKSSSPPPPPEQVELPPQQSATAPKQSGEGPTGHGE